MKKSLKSVLTAAAVVGMLTTGLFLSAATISNDGQETKTEKSALGTNWYSVDVDGQTIIPGTITPPGEDGDCGTTNLGSTCAIALELGEFDPFPSTVNDAQTAGVERGLGKREL